MLTRMVLAIMPSTANTTPFLERRERTSAMQSHFDLIITADYPSRTAELCLRDAHGVQLAFRQMDFNTISISHRLGLFDLRDYIFNYVAEAQEAASIAEIGVCIAEEVLGEEIFRHLWASESQRTLRIQLPGATDEENHLVAWLARVPWEFARPSADKQTLGERNLLVRVVHDMSAPATQPLELKANESLRVLFVFAEARGSHPLAARKERQELLRLFEKEIYPHHRIEAHFLTHGVTRERLEAQIQENDGYHIVHWSGHGHLNSLELAKPGGASDRISGEELLKMFTNAGGFIPRLFFLSACHSGDILGVRDWNDFLAVAQGKQPRAKQSPAPETKDIPLDEQPGYTGTAHALLRGGVPSVIAMRYAVGDEYARDLAVEFYRRLLADAKPKNAAAALTMARRQLRDAANQGGRYEACDHATPVLYGENDPGLNLQQGRSPALDTRDPCLHQITELTTAGHEHFVGRTWELTALGAEFIGASHSHAVKPVAVVTGLGGMGKTALAAEALELWQSGFDWVLLHQAKPNRLEFDGWLRDIHMQLNGELKRYHHHIKENPADAIYRAPDADFTGAERFERLTRNLLRALRDEAILLVLDNFETNLKPKAENPTAAEPHWACQDESWDRCLALLVAELGGTRSRVLITCRRPLAALAGAASQPVLLGPLPPGEAALYLRQHAGLSRMIFSGDSAESALAIRLLNASQFYPLLMDRLARLATGDAALRPQLLQALETLEQSKDFAQLPELFTAKPGDARELAYLHDALETSLDQLIADASPDARPLLWMIAVANEPVKLALLQSVWSGEEDAQTQQLRQIKQMLDILPLLPPEVQEQLKVLPPESRAKLDALPPLTRPDPVQLLRYLEAVGLVTEERDDPDDPNPALSCHELVRERIRAWMEAHPQERADLTENSIRLSYAERLAGAFKALQLQNMAAALQAGSRALIYCVQAGDYDRLIGFASGVVVSTSNPYLLEMLLPHLQAAANSAPEGRLRWSCLCNLADALNRGGRPDVSLPFYEQAAMQAHGAAKTAQSGSKTARQAWADIGTITGNWANALLITGNLDAARQRRVEEAEANEKAGGPIINAISSELEILRIEIMQGQAAQALPHLEARLAQVEGWWQRYRSGQSIPEAPNPEFLARVLISALDIFRQFHFTQQEWEAALRRIEDTMEVRNVLKLPREDTALGRGNRAYVLGRLGRFDEAKDELEACLWIFRHDPANYARTLSMLAELFDEQGDSAQAIIQESRALALREQLSDPRDRAPSHSNLALYLERSSTPSDLAGSSRHRLAALIYLLVAELEQNLQTSLHSYAVRFRRAHETGTPLPVPRVAALLKEPGFRPLDDWLRLRQVDVDELQAVVDQYLEMARQAALAQDTKPTS
jgi:tetratricopeptide (TPR) repeat protein